MARASDGELVRGGIDVAHAGSGRREVRVQLDAIGSGERVLPDRVDVEVNVVVGVALDSGVGLVYGDSKGGLR